MAEVSMDLAELDQMREKIKELDEYNSELIAQQRVAASEFKKVEAECEAKMKKVVKTTVVAQKHITPTHEVLNKALSAAISSPSLDVYQSYTNAPHLMRGGVSTYISDRREVKIGLTPYSMSELIRVLNDWAETEIVSSMHSPGYDNVLSETKEYVNLDGVKQELLADLNKELVEKNEKLDIEHKKALESLKLNNLEHSKAIDKLNDENAKRTDERIATRDKALDELIKEKEELEETIKSMNRKETWREKLAAWIIGNK